MIVTIGWLSIRHRTKCVCVWMYSMNIFYLRNLVAVAVNPFCCSDCDDDDAASNDDHAVVSFGSTQHSLSSSLSESSDSDSSMATRRAKIDATSWNAVERSFSFCSIFSTLRNLMPANENEINENLFVDSVGGQSVG